MKTYKDLSDNLWAYEEDGSQDYIIPSEYVLITDEEANNIRAKQEAIIIATTPAPRQPTVEDLMLELQTLTTKIQAL